ncbi:MAG: tetratricopeptide repeat protein [Rhizobiaceae bacterium]
MLIFKRITYLVLGAVLISATPQIGHAFDPEKVFENEKPSSSKLFQFFFKARESGKEEDAISALKYAADKGNPAAQWKLGRMYQIGDGVPKDPGEAFRFFEKIVVRYIDARPGTSEWQFTSSAMVALGHYHKNGIPEAGIARDATRAQVMFTTAATYFDNPEAQYELARIYLDGDYSAGDVIQAARMLKLASATGHAGAEAMLGKLIFDGEYLRRDPVRGLTMMLNAKSHASGKDVEWISNIQEEAFALATEEERRAAIEAAKQQQASN